MAALVEYERYSQGYLPDLRLLKVAGFQAPIGGWFWAPADTSKDGLRDGVQAVEPATRACQLSGWNEAAYLDTLAAAYAEKGDYEDAVRWQQKALELAREQAREEYQTRLELYRRGQPYRLGPVNS